MTEMITVTYEEYRKYTPEERARYWWWRKGAIKQDRVEVERIKNKLYSIKNKEAIESPRIVNKMEDTLVRQLNSLISKIRKRKLMGKKDGI